MVSQFVFRSLAELTTHLKSVDTNTTKFVYILFTGNKNEDGVSWCPQCTDADPVIQEYVKDLDAETSQFITCYTGDRPTWKNPENEFRKSEFQVKSVPTLTLWKSKKVLSEEQCAQKELVQMLFEEAL